MTLIQIKRGAASVWAAANPILAEGEIGLELDTDRIKVGNGLLNWNDLPYLTLNKNAAGLDQVDNTSDLDKPVSTATLAALDGKQDIADKGQANGYAALDSTGLVPLTQLPVTQADWETLEGKPTYVAAGATKADARSAIDAEDINAKGQPNGYASLDGLGLVPLDQLPDGIGGAIDSVQVTAGALQFYAGTDPVGDPISLLVSAVDGGTPSTVTDIRLDGGFIA